MVKYKDLYDRAIDLADMKTSDFVSDTDVYSIIDTYLREVYDIFITSYEDYFLETNSFTTTADTERYTLASIAPDFYKLKAIFYLNSAGDRQMLRRFTLKDLEYNGRMVGYIATAGIGYIGIQYRLVGQYMYFSPLPRGSENMELWYIKKFPSFIHGDLEVPMPVPVQWEHYVVYRTAEVLLIKEESDSTEMRHKAEQAKRDLLDYSEVRDQFNPKYITDVESNDYYDYEF
jgi:hypothetical protein